MAGSHRATRAGRRARLALLSIVFAFAAADGRASAEPPKAPPAGPPVAPLSKAAAFGAVEGTTVDEAGKPVGGAQVVLGRETPRSVWKAQSDAQGRFSVKGIAPGPLAVSIRARGRIPFEQSATIEPGQSLRIEAKLAAGVRFAGKVTDLEGKPVAGASVVAMHNEVSFSGPFGEFRSLGFGGSAKTGPDGAFDLDGLKPGSTYTLRVTHPRHALLEIAGMAAQAGGGHGALDFTLEDAAWATGVVVDPAGKPIAGANLTGPSTPNAVTGGWFAGFFLAMFLSDDERSQTKSDAQGRFEVGGFTDAEDATVRASAEGYFDGSVPLESVTPGKGVSGVKVVLEPATAVVEGLVADGDGKPVAGAVVDAWGDAGTAGTATSDAQGRFRIDRVKSHGPVTLNAHLDGYLPASVEKVTLGSKDARLALRRSPRVRLRVLDEHGKPIAKVVVVVRTTSGEDGDEDRLTLDQGEKGLDVVVGEGTVTFEVSAPGYEPQSLGPWTTASGVAEDAGTITLVPTKE